MPETSPSSPQLPLRMWYLREVIGTLAGAVGPRIASCAARGLARGVFEMNAPARQKTIANVGAALPDRSAGEHERIARAAFEHVGAFWAETVVSRRLLTRSGWPAQIEVSEPARWADLATWPRSLLLVSTYWGNPVAGAVAVSQLLRPVDVLVDAASAWMADRLWKSDFRRDGRCRHLPGLRLLPATQAPLRIPQLMDRGGRLLVLLGRKATPRGGVRVRFLGREARYPATVVRLALRHRADIVTFACRRLTGRPHARLELLGHLKASELPPTAPAALQQVLAMFEPLIRACPEQYLWSR